MLEKAASWLRRSMRARQRHQESFPGTATYWERRYASGGNSGTGSYGKFAEFKAEVLNNFVRAHDVTSVIEFGCGDGNQATLARYPRYVGFDVSETAVSLCKRRFMHDATKEFRLTKDYANERMHLALSLDVIFHLVEDDVFEPYMHTLFGASDRYVIIYSSDTDDNRGYEGTHVRHRKITQWIAAKEPNWTLLERVPNRHPGAWPEGSFADFFIYEKTR